MDQPRSAQRHPGVQTPPSPTALSERSHSNLRSDRARFHPASTYKGGAREARWPWSRGRQPFRLDRCCIARSCIPNTRGDAPLRVPPSGGGFVLSPGAPRLPPQAGRSAPPLADLRRGESPGPVAVAGSPQPIGGPAPPGAMAQQEPPRTTRLAPSFGPVRISLRFGGISVCPIVRTPFPNVAVHVVQTPGVR